MSQQGSKPSCADQNPEALATFAATARNDGKRPKDNPETLRRHGVIVFSEPTPGVRLAG